MGMAFTPMVQSAHRPHWPVSREAFPSTGGCTFQVDRGTYSSHYISCIDYRQIKRHFATFGPLDLLMSDNGSGFTSVEFQQFLAANGIKQVFTSPYHPLSNGLADRAVQTFKNAVTKLDGPMEVRLSQFLFKYRITPQTTTGVSPTQLLMGRRLRTHLHLLHPDTAM